MRAMKIVSYVLGSIVALLVLFGLAVHLFVNPSDFKDRIVTAVRSSTGRELSLPGDIKLSVFPWIALEFGPASLGSPAEFGSEPFASVRHAALRARLLPLLHKQLDIGRVEITGLDLHLVRNAAGRGNWQGKPAQPSVAPATASQTPGSASLQLPDLGGVTITDSRVTFQEMVADHVQFTVGHVIPGALIPVSVALSLTSAPGGRPVPVSSTFELTLDPAAQTLGVTKLELQFAAARLSGSISGNKIIDAPEFHGQVKLEPVSLRDLMSQLGVRPPVTRDAKALSRFGLRSVFAYGHNAVRLSELALQLDDSMVTGSASINDLDSLQTDFQLALDRIDLDRYSAPEPAAGTPSRGNDSAGKPAELPTDTIKKLNLHGTASVGNARVSGINLSDLHVELLARDGMLHIAPLKAQLYGGQCTGEITLDVRGDVPSLKLQQGLANIDVKPLLEDFAKMGRLSGRGSVTLDLVAHGRQSDEMIRSLGGHAAANLTNGAVEGLDLWFEINRARALIQKQALPAGSDSGRTKFDTFKASADIAGGVAATKDLAIESQNLKVTGKGSANLWSKAIDYQVQASILKGSPGTANAGNLAQIPLLITGTLSRPSVRPDLEGMAKARVQQELKQKLPDELKGLFGK